MRAQHPDAPLPRVFVGDRILADAKELRSRLGDVAFRAGLGGGDEDGGFGKFAAGWTSAAYESAAAGGAESSEGRRLIADLVAAYFTSYAEYGDLVDFDTGLGAISQHARDLGYDAVVLFLDELILWLATHLADTTFVSTEASKLATLVEASRADRPVPIVSFIARQRDLTDFLGVGLPGVEKLNFSEIMKHFSGRFGEIRLADTNLPEIVAKRLLAPKGEAERQQLDTAFDTTARGAAGVWDTLLTSRSDRQAFRRSYPFSPALIDTLVAVSGFLQRERTALRLLLQLLVDQRETLAVGDLVPLGDLWDEIAGGEDPFSDELKRHFTRAKDVYRTRLRPLLLDAHGLLEDAAGALPPRHPFRRDDRLVKTLLLAALVPEVEPMRGLTVSRLAALNHGSIVSPIPGQERTVVLNLLSSWAGEVAELRIEGDAQDPTVALQLTGVDTAAILDAARRVDSTGSRRAKIRELVGEALGLRLDGALLPVPHRFGWRGSQREVDVRFGNVRDPADLPDSELRAGAVPRVVIDFPFDEPDRSPADDRARVAELRDSGVHAATVCWLPLFLTEKALDRLGDLVVIDHVLAGDRFEGFTTYLSPQDRTEARMLLGNQAETLRTTLRRVLQEAYGLTTASSEGWVRADLSPGEQFPTLDPTLSVRPPTAASLADAFGQVLDQVMTHRYPAHPRFEDQVKDADLRTCLRLIERAIGEPNQRLDGIAQPDRPAMRKVLGPSRLATTGEAHLVLDRHWLEHFHRRQSEQPGPVTVERLRGWIDEPAVMGLDAHVANLVICAYALMDDRVLVHGGAHVAPGIERLDPGVELLTQTLPSAEDWQAAVARAGEVFGVAAAPRLAASNVAGLADQLRAQSGARREAAGRLVDRLAGKAAALGLAVDSDRMRTAQAAVALLDALGAPDDAGVVAALARAEVPTSSEALGRSMARADTTAAAVERMNWGLLDNLRRLPAEWTATGDGILATLADAASRDELAADLAAALQAATSAATDLLGRAIAPPVHPQPVHPLPVHPLPVLPVPPVAFKLPPSGRVSEERVAAMRTLLQALLNHADELKTLTVDWELEL